MNARKTGLVIFYCTRQAEGVSRFLKPWDGADSLELKKVALPCSGKLDIFFLLQALENGAEGAALFGCPEEECRYFLGSARAAKRVRIAGNLLGEIGLGNDRVHRFVLPNDSESADFQQWIAAVQKLRPLHQDSEAGLR